MSKKKIEIGDIVRIKSGTSVNEEVLVDSFSRGSGGGTMVFGKWRWNDPAQGGGSVLWPIDDVEFVRKGDLSEVPVRKYRYEEDRKFAQAAEALWGVVANVSEGDWKKQTPEWQEAAARARGLYHEALDTLKKDG